MQQKVSSLKNEQQSLGMRFKRILPLNAKISQSLREDSFVHLSFDDLVFSKKEHGEVVLDIYRKFHSKETFLIQKRFWNDEPLYTVNGVVFLFRDTLVNKDIGQKISHTVGGEVWLEVIPDKDLSGFQLRFKEENVQVILSLSLQDLQRIKAIDVEVKSWLEKIESKKHKDELEVIKRKVKHHSKWEKVYLGTAPQAYLQDLDQEILQADYTPFIASQLPWYLQILKTLKRSGYRIEDDRIEESLLQRIFALLPNTIEKEELYEILQRSDGIKRVLMRKKDEEQPYRRGDLKKFIKKLHSYFIIKQERSLAKETNYYLRQGQFKRLMHFLKNKSNEFKRFLTPRFKAGREEFVREVSAIHVSAGRLSKKTKYPETLREKYSAIFQLTEALLKEEEEESYIPVDDFTVFFDPLSKIEKMKAFWVYVVLQDFLFYQMKLSDSESFRIDPGLSMEIQEGGVWGEVIDEFFSEFHTDLLRYIGLGYSRIDIFSRPWRSLINGVHYSYNLPYPALISLDRDGRSVLMLRSSLFYPFKSDLTHLQYNEGARLWAKLFLGSALLRSMGISESRLAIVTLLYILENFSPDELRSMFTYMTEGSLHRWLNFEDRGRIDFEILYVKNIVNTKMEVNHSALYQHIDLILNLILDSYDDLRESARYRLFKRFE